MKKVMITGASEGIGRAFAERLAREGYAVTAVARNGVRLADLIETLPGCQHNFLVADLASEEGLAATKKLVSEGQFNLVINNAGLGIYGDFAETKLSDLTLMMNVNCRALLELSQAFLRGGRPGDSLINVSSNAAFLPMPISSVYTASKSFVTSLSENLWFEQRSRGVYVMGLCPGMTMTLFHRRAGGHDEQIPRWFSQTPEAVVATALRALARRRVPVVICGPQRPVIFLSKFLPRKWLILIAGKVLEWGLAT